MISELREVLVMRAKVATPEEGWERQALDMRCPSWKTVWRSQIQLHYIFVQTKKTGGTECHLIVALAFFAGFKYFSVFSLLLNHVRGGRDRDDNRTFAGGLGHSDSGMYYSDKWLLESQPDLLFLTQSQLCT